MPGHARSQYDEVYRYPAYDAEVDTGTLDPGAAAAAVLVGWRSRRLISAPSTSQKEKQR
jgi:chloramphenicol 3-O-phosphotransferase